MSAAPGRKEHPLSLRLPPADLAIIDRAARLRGRSRTDFMREAAVRAAEQAILDSALIQMSKEGYEAFVAAISGPPKVVPEMAKLFARTPPWELDDAAEG